MLTWKFYSLEVKAEHGNKATAITAKVRDESAVLGKGLFLTLTDFTISQ